MNSNHAIDSAGISRGDHDDSGDRGDRGPAATKAALRRQLRRRRNALSAAQQAHAAQRLAAEMQRLPAFARARRIAFYIAGDGEIDPGPAVAAARARGAKCYAPVIGRGKILRFAAVTARTEFRAGRFGIAEPVANAGDLIDATALDLALVPLVGFDRRGNRIGMGGGFYDATFAAAGAPMLVGLAHELQRIDAIAADAWDMPLAAVVTDRRIYHCAATAIDDAAAAQSPPTENQHQHRESIRCAIG